MGNNTWGTADPHWGHQGVCEFLRSDGTKLRPWTTAAEMDEALIERWNSVVRDHDRVYVLGDLAMRVKVLKDIMPRLKGRKVVIKGNHDVGKLKDYTPWFDDIRACHVLDGMILTHIPIHPDSLARFGTNVHGHLHANRVTRQCGIPELRHMMEIDPRYHCVSVEHTDYTPISLEDLKKKILAEGGTVGFKPKEAVYGSGAS